MLKSGVAFLVLGAVVLGSGCQSAPYQDSHGGINGEIPANSSFSKLTITMPEDEVKRLLGEPADIKTYPTGKNFIPFYCGGDKFRREFQYDGEGKLTLCGGGGFWGTGGFTLYRITPTK